MAGSGEEKSGNDHASDFSRIVELITANSFSREEISRFLEILKSKAENESEKQSPESGNGEEAQLALRTNEILRTPFQEKKQDTLRKTTVNFHEKIDGPTEVSASPIDIARAYMASCTAERGYDKNKFISKELAPSNNLSSGRPFLPSPSAKPPICWPGAVLHDHSTPQSQRGRQRINESSRTPYSRPILPRSTAKSQFPVDGRYESTSTPFPQSQVSSYVQGKPGAGAYGSIGPIRRMRNRFSSDFRPRTSIFSSSKQTPPGNFVPQLLEGSSSEKLKNVAPDNVALDASTVSEETVSATSDMDLDTNFLSRQSVRTILEHLDRNKPTPKEREAELLLATSWRRSPPPGLTDTMHLKDGSSMHTGEPSSGKTGPAFSENTGNDFKSKFMADSGSKDTSAAKAALKGKAIASDTDFSDSGFDLPPSFSQNRGSVSQNKVMSRVTTNYIFSKPIWSNGQDTNMAASLELPKNHGVKPSLPPLAISKPEAVAAPSGNGPTFSFPLSASSSLLADLPTPSIFPLSSAATVSAPPPATPSYTFGTSSSTKRLNFSFPSTSSVLKTEDASDPKFSFGSDNNARLSFATLGKDAAVSH